eukprot:6192422-Prymnesium_polylepis.1
MCPWCRARAGGRRAGQTPSAAAGTACGLALHGQQRAEPRGQRTTRLRIFRQSARPRLARNGPSETRPPRERRGGGEEGRPAGARGWGITCGSYGFARAPAG